MGRPLIPLRALISYRSLFLFRWPIYLSNDFISSVSSVRLLLNGSIRNWSSAQFHQSDRRPSVSVNCTAGDPDGATFALCYAMQRGRHQSRTNDDAFSLIGAATFRYAPIYLSVYVEKNSSSHLSLLRPLRSRLSKFCENKIEPQQKLHLLKCRQRRRFLFFLPYVAINVIASPWMEKKAKKKSFFPSAYLKTLPDRRCFSLSL